jgi:TatD DNase family protein
MSAKCQLVDTHCHLDYLADEKLAPLIEQCHQAGVSHILTIGVEPSNLGAVLNIANHHPSVFGALGIHPHHASDYSDQVEQEIIKGASSNKIVAIGECGLDYHYNHSPATVQKEVFERELDLASQLNLPVIIHTREADEDTIQILKNFSNSLPKKGVLHCYSAGEKLAQFVLDQGFYLGFTGIITFAKADNVRKIVRMTPLERLLIETDAPFLAPKPHRGRKNSPLYLPYIAQEMAVILNQNSNDLYQQLRSNTTTLFGLPI